MNKKIIFAVVFCFVASSFGLAQDIERAASDVDSVVSEQDIEDALTQEPREETKTDIIEKPPVLPSDNEVQFYVREIKLSGIKSITPLELAKITDDYSNRKVTLAEIKNLCTKVERLYMKKGLIAVCVMQPQVSDSGIFTIEVIEARMGEVKPQKAKWFSAKSLKRYWQLLKGELIQYDKISRSLQNMNRNPDRKVKAALTAGEKPGTTDVILTQDTKFPVHITGGFDNEGTRTQGRDQQKYGIIHNNFLGLDDTLYSGYTGSKNSGGVYAFHKIPVTGRGTSLLYGYSKSRSFPKKDFEPYHMNSSSDSFLAALYQDIYDKADYKGDMSIGIAGTDKHVVWRSGTLYTDKTRTVKAGLKLLDRNRTSSVLIKGEVEQGLRILGARAKHEYSSREASGVFTTFNLKAQHLQRFPGGVKLNTAFEGQIASERLLPQYEKRLGGISSVRGYPSGEYSADNAYQANVDLTYPAFFIPSWVKVPYGARPIKKEIRGVFFADYAYGEKRGVLRNERDNVQLASIGAGVEFRLFNQCKLELYWGFPIGDMPQTEYARDRFHFKFSFTDELPSEWERLKNIREKANSLKEAKKIIEKEYDNKESDVYKLFNGLYQIAENYYLDDNNAESKKYYSLIVKISKELEKNIAKDITEGNEIIKVNKYLPEEPLEETLALNDIIKQAPTYKKLISLAKGKLK